MTAARIPTWTPSPHAQPISLADTPDPDDGGAVDEHQPTPTDTLIETTLPVTFAQNAPSFAMSEAQYARHTQQIRESPTGAATSIWLALAFTCAGVAATVFVGALTGTVTTSAKDQLEIGAGAALVVAAIFLVVHIAHYRHARGRSEAIIRELDTYILRRGPPHNTENKLPDARSKRA